MLEAHVFDSRPLARKHIHVACAYAALVVPFGLLFGTAPFCGMLAK